jgi:hypothetical protein
MFWSWDFFLFVQRYCASSNSWLARVEVINDVLVIFNETLNLNRAQRITKMTPRYAKFEQRLDNGIHFGSGIQEVRIARLFATCIGRFL